MDLKALIRNVPGFPKPGIVFRDITTLIKDGAALDEVATRLADHFREKRPDLVLGVESRGFIIGSTNQPAQQDPSDARVTQAQVQPGVHSIQSSGITCRHGGILSDRAFSVTAAGIDRPGRRA